MSPAALSCPRCGELYALCTCVRPPRRLGVDPLRLRDDPSVPSDDPVRRAVELLRENDAHDPEFEASFVEADAKIVARLRWLRGDA